MNYGHDTNKHFKTKAFIQWSNQDNDANKNSVNLPWADF